MYPKNRNRRGAALIIALVLLTVLAVIASIVLAQIVRDRQEARLDLIRQQSDLLLGDALRIAEKKRESDSDFTGETITLLPEHHPLPGTFRITTQYQHDNSRFTAEVEYRNEKDKIMYVTGRQ